MPVLLTALHIVGYFTTGATVLIGVGMLLGCKLQSRSGAAVSEQDAKAASWAKFGGFGDHGKRPHSPTT